MNGHPHSPHLQKLGTGCLLLSRQKPEHPLQSLRRLLRRWSERTADAGQVGRQDLASQTPKTNSQNNKMNEQTALKISQTLLRKHKEGLLPNHHKFEMGHS